MTYTTYALFFCATQIFDQSKLAVQELSSVDLDSFDTASVHRDIFTTTLYFHVQKVTEEEAGLARMCRWTI